MMVGVLGLGAWVYVGYLFLFLFLAFLGSGPGLGGYFWYAGDVWNVPSGVIHV